MQAFNFGYYSGEEILNVWSGKKLNDKKLIIDFLNAYLNILTKKDERPFWFPLGHPDPSLIDASNLISISFQIKKIEDFHFHIAKNYVIITAKNEEETSIIKEYIKLLLSFNFLNVSSQFSISVKDHLKKIEKETYSINNSVHSFLKSLSNPYYVIWAMKNVDQFYIDSNTLDVISNSESKILKTFEVEEIKNDIISFKPIFDTKKVTIPEELILISNEKEKAHKAEIRFQTEQENSHFDNDNDDIPEYWSDGSCICCEQSPCICYD